MPEKGREEGRRGEPSCNLPEFSLRDGLRKVRALPTFGRWLRQQKGREDSIGDLARDFCDDEYAKRLQNRDSIRRHIERHNPCIGALEALDKAYSEWREIANFPEKALGKVCP